MRQTTLTAARVALLGGPVVIAFFTGGYRDVPRAWAGIVVWALVAVGLALAPGTLPRERAPRIALAGLAGLAAWTLLSTTWAPVAGDAWHAGQLVVLYAGALLAAAILLGPVVAWVEPALAGGALVVVGYGLSERLLPGLLSFDRSVSAFGRLEQPLTYWNAMGAVAALGLVLCARLGADATRPGWLRNGAVAAAAPLGLGLSLTVSRGALFAAGAGLLTLVVVARRREQLALVVLAVLAAALAALCAAPFSAVTILDGTRADREGAGAVVLALLVAIMLAAAFVRPRLTRSGPLRLPRRAGVLTLGLVCAGLAVAVVGGADRPHTTSLSTGAQRYTTFQSNRYEYWRVARRAFADQPLHGVGAGGWAVYWRRYRPFGEGAHDAHSLYIQTAAELGLVGLALLCTFLGGVALSARAAIRRDPRWAAGPAAGCAVWAAHVALDWDFQLPAATLPAILLAGVLLTGPQRSAAPRA